MNNWEELRQAERESERLQETFATPRRQKKQVTHKTRIGELIFEAYDKRATPLLFMKVNQYSSDLLQQGLDWWAVEAKIKRILDWGKSKGVHPMGLCKVFNAQKKETDPSKQAT